MLDQAAHKAAIDLEHVKTKVAQIGQRCIAGAKVINRDGASNLPHMIKEAHRDVIIDQL